MKILIDGYNLLHVTGLAGAGLDRPGVAPGTLQRARNALLNFLAASLDQHDRQLTTVVFDSSDPPPGLPREVQHRGITVKYATGYESADEMLEELIREVSAPRRLIVVSSDHRVQRAGKRRRARAIDSDIWYAELCESRCKAIERSVPKPARPVCPLSDKEVAAWLNEFGDVCIEDLSASATDSAADPGSIEQTGPPQIENPFPPGYAEDLLDDL